MKKIFLGALAVATIALSCSTKSTTQESSTTLSGLDKTKFQTEIDGKKTDLYVLTNKNGIEVTVTNYGGVIVSIMVPDKNGAMQDVVLGFDSVQDYKNIDNNFGATIGRYGNRIANAKFELEGTTYTLPANNYGHTLHGGPKGYNTQVFDVVKNTANSVELSYLSKDGEEGFPGNLTNKVTFTLTDNDELRLDYEAITDKTTVVNLTNHSYFNLDGDGSKTNANNLLYINADSYTPIDSTFATTGEILPVGGTDMDFRKPIAIGARINNYDFKQLKNGNGYDHNWVLNTQGDITKVAATLESPITGIVMDVYTTEPGVQFYAGNFLDGTIKGKKGIVYPQRASVCLETQKYPDTPNKPDWPSVVLKTGDKYTTSTIYKFSVKK